MIAQCRLCVGFREKPFDNVGLNRSVKSRFFDRDRIFGAVMTNRSGVDIGIATGSDVIFFSTSS